ncbi:MAG: 3,4-dihydroxy-2-butanone-4-phosphate synthase [Pseudomonadales bacterium]
MTLNTIEEIIDDIRLGKMVILMDDESRENEGDLIIAADVVTPEHITFFARNACGLVCLTITEARAEQLSITHMVRENGSQHETNFTVSIEAADGISTGISAADRAHTIRTAVAKRAEAEDIVTPGHVFPIIAKPGGVLTRAGHTEAGCDLARLAGYEPSAVIVEIMNEDGTMAKREQLEIFAEKHGIKIGTIADLIQYRTLNEQTIERMSEKIIETKYGEFKLITYRDQIYQDVHIAMVHGEISESQATHVRVQPINTLRDVIGAVRTGHKQSWSAASAMQKIQKEGCGVLVLVGRQDTQDELLAQIEAFPDVPKILRPPSEEGMAVYRAVGTAAQILRDLGVGKMKLLSQPVRVNAISGFSLEIVDHVEPE